MCIKCNHVYLRNIVPLFPRFVTSIWSHIESFSAHGSSLFVRASDGTPYLKVHHRVHLAHGGPDTVANTLALCPNCHRLRHFGRWVER
ncbi:HNH endonuclease signature motif containing protein [Alicycliphilus denitrificans]|uniref:HNH endonuclease signature motif containing protein n=1 Tax=Alicycliphilus denitrificans TaxID=179636 RepID=UPI002ED4FD79